LPYGVNQTAWGDKNFTSYLVAPTVTSHSGNGVGTYCFFRDAPVTAFSSFVVPDAPGVSLNGAFSNWLSGNADSKIEHVINGKYGDAAVAYAKG